MCLRVILTLGVMLVGQFDVSMGQSVAQQCLTEQVRNNQINNNNLIQGRQPAEVTMAAFDAICRDYPSYVNCFDTRLPTSNNPADRFLALVLTTDAMTTAYDGLCNDALEELRDHVQCLLSTPEVRRCYNAFNLGVNQVINLLNQNRFPRVTLQELACNVSVDRYLCETAVYGFCNQRAGEIMQDFFFAGLTETCREATGVTSRFVNGGMAQMQMSSQGALPLVLSIVTFLSVMFLR